MPLLITKTIAAAKLQIAIGMADSEFNTFINEAQEFDFKPLVEENFYVDLLKNRADVPWKKLIDGGEYTYEDRTFYFQGIATVISYFAYARCVMSSNVVSTTHGFVQKNNPSSTPLSLEERRNYYYKKREEANLMLVDCVKFIERNITDYSSWNENTGCTSAVGGPGATSVIQ